MCRVFGFRSVLSSRVHRSLISSDNALLNQSEEHPDGWGVAYYIHNTPHIVKQAETANTDHLFQRVSGIASSETVIAHIRKSTEGKNSLVNTHPFQFGKWVFAHNGHIHGFELKKQKILDKIPSSLSKYILGETDSEHIFYYLLARMAELKNLDQVFTSRELVSVFQRSLTDLENLVGKHTLEDSNDLTKNYFTFLLSDGQSMLAYQGGKDLHYSVHKTKCSESSSCDFYTHYCETEDVSGKVNHLLFSSEPISGENIWQKMPARMAIAIDVNMILLKENL